MLTDSNVAVERRKRERVFEKGRELKKRQRESTLNSDHSNNSFSIAQISVKINFTKLEVGSGIFGGSLLILIRLGLLLDSD